LFTSLLPLAALVAATQDASNVLDLTKDTFDSEVKSAPLIMVEFYAPWCGHCKALAPEYEKAADELKPLGVPLAKVDCTAETDLCSSYGVQGYPTLKVFRDGTPSDYSKARKADEIVAYLKKQQMPAISDVSSSEIEEFKTKDKVVIVGFFNEKAGKEYEAFKTVANRLRDDFVFGAVVEKDVAKAEGVKIPGFVVYKSFDEGKNVFPENAGDEKAVSVESLTKFITVNSVPLMNDIGPDNYMKYVESGVPLAYLFIASDKDRSNLAPVFEPLAKEHRGKINFVYIDANQFGGHARNLNLKEEWPALAVQLPEKNLKYPFDQKMELNKENVSKFVSDFLAGKIEPSIKSEPIPEKNDEPVKVIVSKSFEDIALDATKDVLVEFYAPWCGHCKRLAPIYDELAEKLSGVDSIVIAKMDATENDIPPGQSFTVEGFPTIKLFKANNNEIMDFNGERTVEGFLSFLKENAAIKFEIPESSEKPKKAESGEKSSETDEHDEL